MANSKEQVLEYIKAQTAKLNEAFNTDKPDAKKQEEALDKANLLLKVIDEKTASNEDLKALIAADPAFAGQKQEFADLVKKDSEKFNKKHGKTYSFNASYAKGDAAGKEFAIDAGEAGKGIHDGAVGIWDSIKGMFSGSPKKKDEHGNEVEELDENGKPKKSGIGAWFSSLNVGGIVGSILGIGGAFMAGNIFGGGLIGTIAKWLLVPALAIIGNKWGKDHINGWMGRDADGNDLAKNDKPVQAQGQQKVLETKKDGSPVAANSKAPGQTVEASKTLTEEDKAQIAAIMRSYNSTFQSAGQPAPVAQPQQQPAQLTYGGRPVTPVNARG